MSSQAGTTSRMSAKTVQRSTRMEAWEVLDKPGPLTVVAETTPFQDFDDEAQTDGEVESPKPDSEEKRRGRAERRQGKETNDQSGLSSEGQAAACGAAPANDQRKKEGGEKAFEGDGKPGSSKK
ncbi:hypothetical protein DOTSEDRAFT_72695 [Dothistroma septosporum NZE10]|uniref:Uncharacterized protein n=1 Tax=Dothistroma septosporum (strain NZE10 / CBS 128990) TaxID=675120 RepID=M2YN48_DOTSN|nr:hypothetical protein DOTSEDRAFT_72695 [Dothistroma septosporum NZE10]